MFLLTIFGPNLVLTPAAPGGAEIAGATVFVLVQAIIYGTFLLNLLAYKDCAE